MDRELLALPQWTPAGAIVWPRAEFKCEYCEVSFTSGPAMYQWGHNYDHLLPQAHYKDLVTDRRTEAWIKATGRDYRNIALSCRICNGIKHAFDPGRGIVTRNAKDIDLDQRAALVQVVRNWIGKRAIKKWTEILEEYKDFMRIVKESYGDSSKLDYEDFLKKVKEYYRTNPGLDYEDFLRFISDQ